MIRSLGGGQIDQGQKTIESTVGAEKLATARPTLSSIDQLLGVPSNIQIDGAMTIRRYRFVPATKEPDPGVFDMAMTFDTASGKLRRWYSRTPVGGIGFKFAAEPQVK